VIGVIVGYIIGYPFGILAQIDGVLAGIMGGLMGPMTGLMISNSKPHLFIGFFTLLYVFVTILVYQLIQKSSKPSKTKYPFIIFIPICIVLISLAIIESNTPNYSQADTQQQSAQKENQQEFTIIVNQNGYSPRQIALKKGIPAILHFQKKTTSGCLTYLIIPDLKIRKELKIGDNLISFIPNKSGVIRFSCGMGMYQGSLYIQ